MLTFEEIESVAREVRSWAEDKATEDQRENGLCGMCFRASARLALTLQSRGVDARVVVTRILFGGHAHVRVVSKSYESLVVDVTATQFNDDFYEEDFPEVLVTTRPAGVHTNVLRVFRSPQALKAWQEEQEHPTSQRVTHEDLTT